jgi:hypothetical protein
MLAEMKAGQERKKSEIRSDQARMDVNKERMDASSAKFGTLREK